MENQVTKSKRLAKNTAILYLRTFIVMCISLITSRFTLKLLGIDNFGIYNIVGGTIAMFSIISGALSSSISRFLTFAIGKGDDEHLKKIFSTSLFIQILLGIIVLILGETVGLWFLNNKLNIPLNRLDSANWVLQFSLISFIINLITLPFNAAIIAHERMKAFAYMAVIDSFFKIVLILSLYFVKSDVLRVYSALMLLSTLVMFIFHFAYCRSLFNECSLKISFDSTNFKEMTKFASWTFFGNAGNICTLQGIDILVNIFFGVTVNAARGIVNQVNNIILSFINNFTTAINPQITKSYAENDCDYLIKIINNGAKFSYLLLMYPLIPIIFETETILNIWLGKYPSDTITFVRWNLIYICFNPLGSPYVTAILATGRIKNYEIAITAILFLTLPITLILYKAGFPPVASYWALVLITFIQNWVRLYYIKSLFGISFISYFRHVFFPIIFCTILIIIPVFIIYISMQQSLLRFAIVICCSILTCSIVIFFFGLSQSQRNKIINKFYLKLS